MMQVEQHRFRGSLFVLRVVAENEDESEQLEFLLSLLKGCQSGSDPCCNSDQCNCASVPRDQGDLDEAQ